FADRTAGRRPCARVEVFEGSDDVLGVFDDGPIVVTLCRQPRVDLSPERFDSGRVVGSEGAVVRLQQIGLNTGGDVACVLDGIGDTTEQVAHTDLGCHRLVEHIDRERERSGCPLKRIVTPLSTIGVGNPAGGWRHLVYCRAGATKALTNETQSGGGW